MSFEKHTQVLFSQIEKIFDLYEKKIAIKKDCRNQYNNYRKVLTSTDIRDHSIFFFNVFKKNKFAILNDVDDKWLRYGDVYIQFNEGSKNMNPKYRIALTAIYGIACSLSDDSVKIFNLKPDKEKLNILDFYPEVAFPDEFIYRFYNTIIAILEDKLEEPNQKELDRLKEVTSKLEVHLGIKTVTPTVTQGPTSTPAVNPLNGLQDITGMITNILGSQSVKNFIGGLMTSMQSNNSLDPISNVVQSLENNKDSFSEVFKTLGSSMKLPPMAVPSPPVIEPIVETKEEDLSLKVSSLNLETPKEGSIPPLIFYDN